MRGKKTLTLFSTHDKPRTKLLADHRMEISSPSLIEMVINGY